MKKNDIARAHAETSNWNITSNNGVTTVANNTKSGVAYNGSTAAFNLMIKTPVREDAVAHFNPARDALVHPETGLDIVFGAGGGGGTGLTTYASVQAAITAAPATAGLYVASNNGALISNTAANVLSVLNNPSQRAVTATTDNPSVEDDKGLILYSNVGSGVFTIRQQSNQAWLPNTQINIFMVGVGTPSFVAEGAVVITVPAAGIPLAAQGGIISLIRTGTDIWAYV